MFFGIAIWLLFLSGINDFGISFFTLLGGEIDDAYQKAVNKENPGLYGSLAVGILNGGGYHSPEFNQNKSIEYRLTIRPLPGLMPGLQFSYQGVRGKGNRGSEPEWTLDALFVSFESRYLRLSGQQVKGVGNSSGSMIGDM